MSWWVGVSRSDWPQTCAQELPRMQASRFGRVQWLDGGTPAHVARPNRAQQERHGEEWG